MRLSRSSGSPGSPSAPVGHRTRRTPSPCRSSVRWGICRLSGGAPDSLSLREAKRRSNLRLRMNKRFYVYILTNKMHTVLYTGVTGDLLSRVYQYKEKMIRGFTGRYNVNRLVYFEEFSDAYNAISREKQLKGGSRKKKTELIKSVNPGWKDLSKEF
ncbi:MAG: GIY-YIG nuclease family protein [Chloroflexota bacterium]